MSGKVYLGTLIAIFLQGLLMGCGGSSSNQPPSTPSATVIAIKADGNAPQTTASGKPFGSPFSVTVTQNGIKVSGQKVTFAAPSSGASGTFANGTATDTEVTAVDGTATSSAFTANSTGGTYSVTASVHGAPSPVTFSLTNVPVTPFAFYLTGMDETFSFYTLAGSVLLDSSGNVLGGVQDYNDGGFGFASPEPAGDTITGGKLTFPSGSPAGQGTLTLNTNNLNLGLNADGVEVFGVQFVNSNHALIMQFDGFATSSGSLDHQTLPSTLSGGYAFTGSGFGAAQTPLDFGGVFSISGTTLAGTIDVNDPFNTGITLATPLSGTLTPLDGFGRGKITGFKVGGSRVTFNYYVINPEAIRIIDVDASDAAIGSAFGQGASTFSNASLGNSVLAFFSTAYQSHFGALAQFSTTNTTSDPANFSGVGDDSEPDNAVLVKGRKILGTYSIASNGYGNWNISNVGLGNLTTLGIYMTDPALNLSDPNNPAGGGGGLAIDMSSTFALPGGTGLIVPQTDISTASLAGNYATGWQNFNLNCGDCEFDMIAQGSMVANGALSLTGLVSDPFFSLGTPDQTSSGNTFTGAPSPDTTHPGRYTMTKKGQWLSSFIDGSPGPNFNLVVHQASGTQLFWLGFDNFITSVSFGPLEQLGSLSGIPGSQGAQSENVRTRAHRRSASHTQPFARPLRKP